MFFIAAGVKDYSREDNFEASCYQIKILKALDGVEIISTSRGWYREYMAWVYGVQLQKTAADDLLVKLQEVVDSCNIGPVFVVNNGTEIELLPGSAK